MVNGVVGMRKIQMAIIAIMATVAASWAEGAVMTPAVGRLPGSFSINEKVGCVLPGGWLRESIAALPPAE